MSDETLPRYLWEVAYGGPAFRMVSRDPAEVALRWLATREDGSLNSLPPTICVDNMSVPIRHPHSGAVLVTSYLLRLRDLEREQMGLPRYWHRLADRLEALATGAPMEEVPEPPWRPPPWMEGET